MSRRPGKRCWRCMSRDARSSGAACGRRRRRMSSPCSSGTSRPFLNLMKRIEVKLALPVVAALLGVIKELADHQRKNLAAPLTLEERGTDFHAAWVDELLSTQNE